MKQLIMALLTVFVANVHGDEPARLSAEDPAFGKELQQIHERGLEHKAGKLSAFKADPAYLDKLGKAIESPACTPESMAPGGKYCPHCGLKECLACSAAIAAAIAACGGPEDLPCIAAALGAMAGCIDCLVK